MMDRMGRIYLILIQFYLVLHISYERVATIVMQSQVPDWTVTGGWRIGEFGL